jgi:hypothetical protein
MKKTGVLFSFLAAVVAVLSVCAGGAEAVLRDFGPLNFGGFPSWYRDNNGVAVQQCLSHAVSPVSSLPICNILPDLAAIPPFDATKPITFPPNPPTGYNYPPESFYYSLAPNDATFAFAAGKGKIVIVLALEGAFTTGNPIPGDQSVFSRVRVFLTQGVPNGNYKITHPYGVENLTVTGGLLRYTRDIGLTGIAFTGPLAGDMGPFFTWSVDPLLVAAGKQNPDGTLNGLDPVTSLPNGEVFLGDFNLPHTFTGSPFGTNFFRCDGPPGSGIGGPGIDFIQTNLGFLEGWKYTIPIPSPLTVDRAVYRRDAATGQVDIFASASVLSNQATPSALTVTGLNLPAAGVSMASDGKGKFFAHIGSLAANQIPAQVTVTNTADNPPTAVVADISDEVVISAATYEPTVKNLTVAAASGDTLLNPALTLEGFGPIPVGGTISVSALDAPPATLKVVSAARGVASADLLVRPFAPPVAGNDAASVATGGNVVINVVANDTASVPATIDPTTVAIVASPAQGSVSVNATTGAITYTPAVGPATTDSFTYTVKDSNTIVSNVATVSVSISVLDVPPTANNDSASATVNVLKNIAVLANDNSATSTLDPASVKITTPPAAGATATILGNGTIDFTATATGTYTFQYTVADTFTTPLTSNTATVTVTVSAPNQPPVANPDTATTTAATAVTVNVIANDTDPDGTVNPGSIVIVTPPANGTAVVNLNGTVRYTPAAGFTGTNQFTYNVKDNLGAVSNNTTVTVTVNAAAAETLTVTRSQFTLAGTQWRIDGTTTARVAGETIKIFNSALVPADGTTGLLTTVTVAGNGSWTWTSSNPVAAPNAARKISFQSSLTTKLENVTVTVR